MQFFIFLNLLNFYSIYAHTWIESVYCSDTNTYGYIRNYQGRDIADTDIFYTFKILDISPQSSIISPNQNTPTYNNNFPKLSCPIGSNIIITYMTDGHTFFDKYINGDPRGPSPSGGPPDTFWSIHTNNNIYPRQLLTVSDVDTNPLFNSDVGLINNISTHNLYNFNRVCATSNSQLCNGTFQLPLNLKVDTTLQFVWLWQFNKDYKSANLEWYTSVFDIDIKSNNKNPTELPITELPTTELPTTELPTTELLTTELPTTELPTTELPTNFRPNCPTS